MCYFTKQQMLFFRPHTYLTSRDHPQSVRALHVLMKALHKHHILDSKNDHSRFDLQSTLFRRNHTPLPGRYCFIGRKPCRQSNQEHSLYPPRPEATTRLSSPASRAHTTRLNTTPTGKSGGLTRPLHRNPARMALLVLKPTSLSPSSEDLLCQSKSTRVSSSLTLTTCLQKTSQTSRSSSER